MEMNKIINIVKEFINIQVYNIHFSFFFFCNQIQSISFVDSKTQNLKQLKKISFTHQYLYIDLTQVDDRKKLLSTNLHGRNLSNSPT